MVASPHSDRLIIGVPETQNRRPWGRIMGVLLGL